MKNEEKKSAQGSEKDGLGSISRRVFLKDAGFVVGAPGIGSLATSALAATPVAAAGAAATSQRVGESDATEVVELTVNGGRYRFNVEPDCSLRSLLRDQMGLTSPKDWCGGQGACGSCTVIVNGRPVLSCLTLASECNGAKIETAEGIAKAQTPDCPGLYKQQCFPVRLLHAGFCMHSQGAAG